MALAFANFKRMAPKKGGFRSGYVDITLDASYSSGGWAITAANLVLSTLHNLIPPGSKNGFVLEWDHVNGKLKAYQEADGASALGEIDAADLSAAVVRCFYEGW